jgi:hypothetical protein
MIVIGKMLTSDGKKKFEKLMIRDRTFFQIDEKNKKVPDGNRKISEIEGVLSLKDGKFQVVPTAAWLEQAQSANFWGS